MTSIDLNQNPYFDDFDESKKFHQIVFNPSVAVQARELSQVQDILQNQIKRSGDFILSNGSKVTGGSTYTDFDTFKFAKLETTFNSNSIDVSTWTKGTILTGTESGAKFELLDSTSAGNDDPETIFGRYISGVSVTDGLQSIDVESGGTGYDGTAVTVTIDASPGTNATGTAVVDIPSGKVIAVNVDITGDGYGATSITTGTVTSYDINGVNNTITIVGGGTWQNLAALDTINIGVASDTRLNHSFPVVSAVGAVLTVTDVNTRLPQTSISILSGDLIIRKVPNVVLSGGGASVQALVVGTLNTSNIFIEGEQVTDGTTTINGDVQTSTTVASGTALGDSSYFSIDEGVYYIDGFFVKNDAQSIILEKYNNTPTWNVGFDVIQSIIQSSDDNSLLDPSQGSFNFNAPGADRFKIELILAKKLVSSQDLDDFIQIIKLNGGVIEQSVSVPILGEIEKTIARRTFDESGSYTVKPYPISIKDHPTDTTKLRVGIEPGKSFVQGFEHENISTFFLDMNKARDTELVSAGNTIAQYGNYIIVESDGAGSTFDGAFDINAQEVINLYSVAGASTQIGTARIRQIEYNAINTLRFYLYDINLTSGTFADLESVGLSGTQFADIADLGKVGGVGGGDAILFDSDFNSMLFKIPDDIIKSTQDPTLGTNYQFRKLTTGVTFDGSGNASIVLSGTETFPGAGTTLSSTTQAINFQIFATSAATGAPAISDGDLLVDAQINSISIDGPGTTATIDTTATATFNGDVVMTVQTTAEPVKTKTLITNQKTTVNTPNVNNLEYDSITKADIFELKAVYDSTDGNTPRFVITTITGGPFTVGELADQAVSGAVVEIIEATASSHIDCIVISGTPDTSGVITGRTSGAVTDAVPSSFTDQTDIISSYILDNGQKDNFYDHGRLQLTGTAPTQTDIVIVYNYFTHSASNGYFSVDSYNGVVNYEDIPQYTSPVTGSTLKLTDVFDFRGRRDDGATTISGAEIPISNTNITADYSFYLPRVDKIYIDKDKKFGIVEGNSQLNPLTPNDFPNSMTLYVVGLNAFTIDTKDLNVRFIDNRRFTMRDIGAIEKRLSNMEYYTSLSLLESDTKNLLVSDGAGLDRFKNGILIDSFKGHSVGDVNDDDYICSIDFQNTELRPPFNVNHTELNHDPADTDDAHNTVTGDLLTLPYTETPLISQLLASKAISVNPFNVSTWRGTLTLVPATDTWQDKTSAPDVTINLAGEMDAWEAMIPAESTQTQWNDWEDNWVGQQRFVGNRFMGRVFLGGVAPFLTRQLFDTRVEQSRTGLRTSVVPETISTELGDRVISQAIIPFMRTKNITISAEGMKPNTRVYPFFDDVDVASFCTPSGGSAGDAIFTDSSGSIAGLVFALPNTTATKFRTGSRLFRLIDDETNVIASADTTAETNYTASGILETVQNTIVSTRVPALRTDTVVEEREIQRRTVNNVYWDPVAQTFMVDPLVYPDGIFASSIDLYFEAKPTTTTIPIMVEIRNTENGFPAQRVVPFSTTTLQHASVNISADASVATTFTFESPVYLQPGEEYAITVLSNSNEYKTYIAEMGETVIGGTNKISEQPYAGSLFKSQNASTWTPVQTEDLMFELNRCDFDITTNGVGIFKNPSVAPDSIADVLHVQSQLVEFNTANIQWAYKATTNGGSLDSAFVATSPNQNFKTPVQKEVNTTIGSFILRSTLTSSSKHISPVIDLTRMALITAENIVNNTSTIETITPVTTGVVTTIDYNEGGAGLQDSIDINGGGLWSTELIRGSKLTITGSTNDNNTFTVESGAGTATLTLVLADDLSGDLAQTPPTFSASRDTEVGSVGNAVARYITRRVVLADGFDAKDLNVLLTLNNKSGGSVKVYYKVIATDDPDNFDDKDWVLMNQTTSTSIISNNDDDFIEFEFNPVTSPITYTSGAATYNDFKTYAIKIIMQGTTTNPPRIKDLRAMALAT